MTVELEKRPGGCLEMDMYNPLHAREDEAPNLERKHLEILSSQEPHRWDNYC